MLWEPLDHSLGISAHGERTRSYYVIVHSVGAGHAVTGVRLTRCPENTPYHDPYEQGAAAARNLIEFPLGRGPGRPAGGPEIDALFETAKYYAERYEAGESLEGYPYWLRVQGVDPDFLARNSRDIERQREAGHQCDADGRCDVCRTYGLCSKCGCPDPHPGADVFDIAYRPPDPNAGRCSGPGGCFPGESCDYRDVCTAR